MEFAVEIALCVMIAAWTVVSIALGVLVFMLVKNVQEVVDRLNALLATGQLVANDVRAPVQAVAESVREVFGSGPQVHAPISR